MILSISSSLKSFKKVEFHKGLNILLADSHPQSGDKKTRNSAGKTSLIEIMHFLLGADCDKKSLFRTDALINHAFTGEFVFKGEKVCVERGGEKPAKIYIIEGLSKDGPYEVKEEKESKRLFISNENWKVFLGHTIFGLPSNLAGTAYEKSFTPSFRAMISYFIRRHASGGFISPERQAEKQQKWDWQENLSYLLGLDWSIPYEFQKVKARENSLDELKKAAKQGAFGSVIGTVAELRSKLTVAEKKAEKRRTELEGFQVLDSYDDLASRAAIAKTEMQSLSRQIVTLRENLNHLKITFEQELPPDSKLLANMYRSVGVELPSTAVRKLEEVNAFYDSVIENRETHLKNEIGVVSGEIDVLKSKISTLDDERKNALRILEIHGALADFVALQKELAELENEVASLRERFKAAQLLEGEKTQLDLDRGNLLRRLQQDFEGRKEILDNIILTVTNIITELYDDREGSFEIAATPQGPDFRISIEGDRNQGGINSMEIFCFDLALFKLGISKNRSPRFLVHDSHLFDGVDQRQISRALLLGNATAIDEDGQYIVTMNSDMFKNLPFPNDIDADEFVLDTKLSDDSENGGLFGFRFN